MSHAGPEYDYVVKPFLDELEKLGWRIIDFQGNMPSTPEETLRRDWREIILRAEFFKQVRATNLTENGKEWLEDDQLQDLYDSLQNSNLHGLVDINDSITQILYKTSVDENRLTGEKGPVVHLIDFSENGTQNNSYIAIAEFRIDTPGRVRQHIRPDITLFVNGIPLVVIECKYHDALTAEPMYEAVRQLRRYADQREDNEDANIREGEPKLFYTNQLLIATCGRWQSTHAITEARVGSISSSYEYFFHWKDPYPTDLGDLNIDLNELKGIKDLEERIEAKAQLLGQQNVLIHGMLKPANLLDIVRSFILFPTTEGRKIKIIPRYQQFRAANKAIARFRNGKNARERSGVIWHTQGSGKSYTMVYIVRKIRQLQDRKDYKVILVNDRIDLEEQLSETAVLAGEIVYPVESMAEVAKKLSNDTSNLNVVMMHKFQIESDQLPAYAAKAIRQGKTQFKKFETINKSEKILLMIDEAHRGQSAGKEEASMSDNLFLAFPNATKVAFTGTPLIVRDNDSGGLFSRTEHRFGNYIDTYRINESVEDGATVQILYEGKTANVAVGSPRQFERRFEDLFRDRTPEDLQAIKKRYGTMDDIFEAEGRIEEISQDIVEHFMENILPNNFKAQVVTSSKLAAIRYRKFIDLAVQSKIQSLDGVAAKAGLVEQLKFLKTAVVISGDGNNEDPAITLARRHAREANAVDNFKKPFDFSKPETGMGILIVCDMLLTGFDAPIEQVMYIDKKLEAHNLLQAIARVNRTRPGKSRGYIVDYIGLTHYLKEALSIYSAEDIGNIDDYLKKVEAEIPVLEHRYRRIINYFKEQGIEKIEDLLIQEIKDPGQHNVLLEECVELLEDVKRRETFDVFFKKFCQSMDIIMPSPAAEKYQIPMYQLSLIHNEMRMRYRDESVSFVGVGKKIRDLINQHLQGLGIDPAISPVELMSDNFIREMEKKQSPRARASEMAHAVRKHCRANRENDPIFYDKLLKKIEELIQKYQDDWDALIKEFDKLRNEMLDGRKSPEAGVAAHEAPFFDLIVHIAFDGSCPPEYKEKLLQIVRNTIEILQKQIDIVNFWQKPAEVTALIARIKVEILRAQIIPAKGKADKIATELANLARFREKELLHKST